METIFLVLYVCASAAMDDCQISKEASWQGDDARSECAIEVPNTLALAKENGFMYTTAYCENDEGI